MSNLMQFLLRRSLLVGVVITGVVVLAACRSANDPKTLQAAMRNAYQDTRELFTYLWTPGAFTAPANDANIRDLLERLSTDFHNVDKLEGLRARDPGFTVALETNRALLTNASQQFKAGNRDLAAWKLKGLTSNCIACHASQKVSYDFIGDIPAVADKTVEAQLALAEYLFATRQYDRAKDDLLAIAHRVGQVPAGEQTALDALRLWLVIAVRVEPEQANVSSNVLTMVSKEVVGLKSSEALLQRWSTDLSNLNALLAVTPPNGTIAKVEQLLAPVFKTERLDEDNKHLVPTLAATSLLHQFLEGSALSRSANGAREISEEEVAQRRKALSLLAIAYEHLPISILETFHGLYFEQCIRQFPGTDEAKQSYDRLKRSVERAASGSSGVNIDELDQQRLLELHRLAYGA